MIVFVGDKYNHHAQYSGYHQICSLIPNSLWISETHLLRGKVTFIDPNDSSFSNNIHVTEFKNQVGSNITFVVMHADFSAASKFLRYIFPNAKIIACVHQPLWLIKQAGEKYIDSLSVVDQIIVVSEIQKQDLQARWAEKRIDFLPLGINVEEMRNHAEPCERDQNIVLIVGEYLIDWTLVHRIINRDQGKRRFVAIIPRYHLEVPEAKGIELQIDISSSELATLYSKASCLLLPLIDSTSNLAVLESMGMGCPVVCSDLPELRFSLNTYGFFFRSHDVESAHSSIELLCNSKSLRQSISDSLRKRSLIYDWKSLKQVYQEVIGYEHAAQ